MMSRAPRILVFDSGLGGLTVFREIARARPDASYIYVADDAAFPYGAWREPDLVARLLDQTRPPMRQPQAPRRATGPITGFTRSPGASISCARR